MLTRKEGLVLYACEGNKSVTKASADHIDVTNSNPLLMLLFVEWLESYYDVNRTKVHYELKLWKGMNENAEKTYWSYLLGIPFTNYWGTTWVKPSVNFDPLKHGICKVRYNNTRMKKQLLSEIEKELF